MVVELLVPALRAAGSDALGQLPAAATHRLGAGLVGDRRDGGDPTAHPAEGCCSLAVAHLIGRAFNAAGWDFEPGDVREIGDLPACTFQRDGETVLQPCAETLLGERAGQALLDAGLMPLMSHKHRNAVTVMRLQSVAQPAGPLAGLPQRR